MYVLRVRTYGGWWEPYSFEAREGPELFPSLPAARFRARLLLEYQGAQAVQCLEGRRITHWWVLSVTGELLDAKAMRAAGPRPLAPETLPARAVPWVSRAGAEPGDGDGAGAGVAPAEAPERIS